MTDMKCSYLLLWSLIASGCQLDNHGKDQCAVQSDCLDGFVCSAGATCERECAGTTCTADQCGTIPNACGGTTDCGACADQELIVARGRYWSFDNDAAAAPGADNGAFLEQIPRYASGPCVGRAAGSCAFDTEVVFSFNGRWTESVTAYGGFWNFDIDDHYAPITGNGLNLETVARYASGPCAGQPAGTCRFETRIEAFIDNFNNGRQTESITAYGKFWNFDSDAPLAGSGQNLETVPRFASGPCAGQAPGTCAFDTRSIFVFEGRQIESITAYGRFWNFDVDPDYSPLLGNGSKLETVPRFGSGPCAGVAAGSCRFDSRSVASRTGR